MHYGKQKCEKCGEYFETLYDDFGNACRWSDELKYHVPATVCRKCDAKDRSKFVYENGYGMTTDMWLLPHGTKFSVVNGVWEGVIVEEDGRKYMLIGAEDIDDEPLRKVEITEDMDCNLVVETYKGRDEWGRRRQ